MINFIPISTNRRMDVNIVNNKPMVSIREFYNKDGDWKPGIKGMSLLSDQFNVLQSGVTSIEKAIFRGGMDKPVLDLSATRKVSVSLYKGNILIDFREYYEKDGEIKPGKKGISLTVTQWNLVKEALPAVSKMLSNTC